jgi:hypothetical protein
MDDATLEAALQRMTRRTGSGGLFVGFGTLAMGAVAGLCGVFRVDPDMRAFRPPMWAAYGGMVCFFIAVGLLMIVSSVVLVPKKGRDFVDRVMRRPETLSRLYLQVVRSRYNPNREPGQLGVGTSIVAETTDGKHFLFTVPGAEAEALLQAIAARAPGALIGPR